MLDGVFMVSCKRGWTRAASLACEVGLAAPLAGVPPPAAAAVAMPAVGADRVACVTILFGFTLQGRWRAWRGPPGREGAVEQTGAAGPCGGCGARQTAERNPWGYWQHGGPAARPPVLCIGNALGGGCERACTACASHHRPPSIDLCHASAAWGTRSARATPESPQEQPEAALGRPSRLASPSDYHRQQPAGQGLGVRGWGLCCASPPSGSSSSWRLR